MIHKCDDDQSLCIVKVKVHYCITRRIAIRITDNITKQRINGRFDLQPGLRGAGQRNKLFINKRFYLWDVSHNRFACPFFHGSHLSLHDIQGNCQTGDVKHLRDNLINVRDLHAAFFGHDPVRVHQHPQSGR